MFSITSTTSGDSVVTVYENDQIHTANSDHPNYQLIVERVLNGEPVAHLFNIANDVFEKFTALSNRVTISGSTLFFDHDPITGALADQIVRFVREGHDFDPLVKFYEKLQGNPNEHSREQLYTWLDRGEFTIDKDGDIVMYKGVKVLGDDLYGSIHSGPAIVNNVAVNGHVPQKIGDVVEMPRSEVNHDPSQGCSTGLHASNWDYARSFSTGVVLAVKVNPADVVSVPTDCDTQKVRVCRYTITDVVEYPVESALFDEVNDPDWYYEDVEGDYDFDDDEEDESGDINWSVGDWVSTSNHTGYIVEIGSHKNPDYISAKLYDSIVNEECWVSLPR